jgi:tetratricopeptide (TPR) repeat protein
VKGKNWARGNTLILGSILMIFMFSFHNLSAQQTDRQAKNEPLWMMMERGIRDFDEGRLGDAMKIFRDVAEQDSSYANVHLWMGNVFFAEGEYETALVKYKDALAEGRSFFPASVRTETLYRIAEVYQELGEWDRMDETLGLIMEEAAVEILPTARKEAMLRIFIREGPDKLFELYRVKDKAVRKAYQLRGEILLRKGFYEAALESFLLSVSTIFSLAIDVHRYEDPEYLFVKREMNPGLNLFFTENTALLISESMEVPMVKTYFENTGLFRQLFLMGLALYGMGEREKAEQMWLLVTDHREAGIWYEFAQDQISEADMSVLPLVLHYR